MRNIHGYNKRNYGSGTRLLCEGSQEQKKLDRPDAATIPIDQIILLKNPPEKSSKWHKKEQDGTKEAVI